jgi:hypothetical protein
MFLRGGSGELFGLSELPQSTFIGNCPVRKVYNESERVKIRLGEAIATNAVLETEVKETAGSKNSRVIPSQRILVENSERA